MANVITDFHGVVTRETDSGRLWEHVAKQAVTPLYRALIMHPARTVAFARARPRLKGAVQKCKSGEMKYAETMELYNEMVLSRLPPSFVIERTMELALSNETQQNIDRNTVAAIRDYSRRRVILSTGSRDFIMAAVYPPSYGFEQTYANPILSAPPGKRGSRFLLSITPESKPGVINRIFRKGFRPGETVYIGDNEDEEPAFEYVRANGGRVVVSRYASDVFKQMAATRYNAETPNEPAELARFLKSLK